MDSQQLHDCELYARAVLSDIDTISRSSSQSDLDIIKNVLVDSARGEIKRSVTMRQLVHNMQKMRRRSFPMKISVTAVLTLYCSTVNSWTVCLKNKL